MQQQSSDDHSHDHSHHDKETCNDPSHHHDHPVVPRSSSSSSPPQPPNEANEWMQFLNSSIGQQKLHSLAQRINIAKTQVDSEVISMDTDAKLNYFESFADHPVLKQILDENLNAQDPNKATMNPVQVAIHRINTFSNLDNMDLEKIMKVQAILQDEHVRRNSDFQDKLKIRFGSNINSNTNLMSLLPTPSLGNGTIHASSSSGSNHNGHQCGHDHDHSHGHNHSHETENYVPLNAPTRVPDVVRGVVEVMDR